MPDLVHSIFLRGCSRNSHTQPFSVASHFVPVGSTDGIAKAMYQKSGARNGACLELELLLVSSDRLEKAPLKTLSNRHPRSPLNLQQ